MPGTHQWAEVLVVAQGMGYAARWMQVSASVAFLVGAALLVCHCGGGAESGDRAEGSTAGSVGRAGDGSRAGSAGSMASGGTTARAGTGGTGAAPTVSGATSSAGAGGQQASAGAGTGAGGAAGSGTSGSANEGGAGRGSGAQGGTVNAGGGGAATGGTGGALEPIVESLDIAKVWSGHFVQFHLLTHGDRQYAAFYDEDRALTVAERKLGTSSWSFSRPGTSIGWDSHNYVVMAVDGAGYVHVSGNMHSSPLNYFRSERPLDSSKFLQPGMVGSNEAQTTYPQFFLAPTGELIFMYRDGSSGSGNHIFNKYSTSTSKWSRLLGSPLTDGEGAIQRLSRWAGAGTGRTVSPRLGLA